MFLVPWNDGTPGVPIQLDEVAHSVTCTPGGDWVSFSSGLADARRIARAPPFDTDLGPSEELAPIDEFGTFLIWADGSSLATRGEARRDITIIDLDTAHPTPTVVTECRGEGVNFKLSPRGSLLHCSRGPELLEDRTHLLGDTRTAQSRLLSDAAYAPVFLPLDPSP